jgi:hypothetical protein
MQKTLARSPFPITPMNSQDYNQRALARLEGVDLVAQAHDLFRRQLEASAEVGSIAQILCNVSRRQTGEQPCLLEELALSDLKRARSFLSMAEHTLARLDEDVEDAAIQEVARVICEGDGEYSSLASQHPAVQTRYRRWAVSAVNAYYLTLEGR